MAKVVGKSLKIILHQQTLIKQLRYQQQYRTLNTVAKKYVFSKHFSGEPKPTDLALVEEELPAIKDGGINKLFYYKS